MNRKMRTLLRCWWPWGRSPVLVPLVACVIVLQTLILFRMNDNTLETGRMESNSMTEENRGGYGPYSGVTADSNNSAHLFDLKSCRCGLHFRVDEKQAQVFAIPKVTEKKFLTIGIPTVKRRGESYIVDTVTSLMSNMDAAEKKDVIIVIMVADLDMEGRNFTLRELHNNFLEVIGAGSIHVIAPPLDLYTNLKVTKQTYGQDLPYVQWRAKQNFDYAYLMRYSASLSSYYVQLEDDVITAPAYVTSMRQYIDDQKDAWTCLEFSELGFIGKLYRSKDLDHLSQLLLMFFQEQPVDYTYLYFNMLMTQLQKRLRTPTLFQHRGIHSSFPGKIQPLKDRFFDNMTKRYKGHNPPAEIFTTFKTYLNFLPRLPYSHSEGYFWTDGSPVAGDTFIVVFDVPQFIDRVIIDSGSESHPSDILENARLKASLTVIKTPARMECTNDIDLGTFKDGRIEVKDIASMVKFKIVCLQIQVLKEQTAWVIIREIAVFVSKEWKPEK